MFNSVYQRLKNCCSAKLHFRGMYTFTEMCFTIMIEGKASECEILLQAIQGHNHLRGVMSSGVYQRLKKCIFVECLISLKFGSPFR